MDQALEAQIAELSTPMTTPEHWKLFAYVQAFLAISIILSVIAFYAIYKWVPEGLTTMASMAFGFYFGKATERIGAKHG